MGITHTACAALVAAGLSTTTGAHGSLGFGASGLGGQSRSADYGGSLGAGYGVALGDRTALALGLSLNASTALGAYSNGSEIRTYLNDVVSVGVTVPVTVMISQGVYIEPYLTAHFAASLNPEVANNTSIGFGVGHRIGFVL